MDLFISGGWQVHFFSRHIGKFGGGKKDETPCIVQCNICTV